VSGSAPFYLGILTDRARLGNGGPWPEHAYPHLFSICPEGVRLFLFRPADIDWSRGAAGGWTAEPAPSVDALRWRRGTFPLPHAVYNRISRRRTEGSRACQRLFERLSRRAPLFNPGFLGKCEVHQWLSSSPASRFLPATLAYEGPPSLFEAVRRFGAAVVKPDRGSLGRRIACVEPRGRRFLVRFNADRGTTERLLLSATELAEFARRWYPPGSALVQERVPLLLWKGRPFDLRALLQRLPGGVWSLTGAAGRLAPEGGVTTHTLRGGERVPLAQLQAGLGHLIPRRDQLEAALAECAQAIETARGARFFEFSFDVGLTAEGRLCVFEANAKPFPFDEEDVRTAAAARLFAFARAAAEEGLAAWGAGDALVAHGRGA